MWPAAGPASRSEAATLLTALPPPSHPARRSLRRVLTLRLATLIALQGVLAALGLFYVLIPALERNAHLAMAATGEAVARRVGDLVQRADDAVRASAALLDAQGELSPGGLQRLLAEPGLLSPEILVSYWVDAQGYVRHLAGSASAPALDARTRLGLDVSRSPVLERAQAGRPGFTEPFLSPVTEGLMVGVTYPVGSRGWLVGEIGMDSLSRELQRLVSAEGFSAMVIDPQGRVLAHPDSERSRQAGQLSREALRKLSEAPAGTAILQFDEQEWATLSRPIAAQGMDWQVLVMRPQAEVVAPVRRLQLGLLLFVLLLMVSSFAMALLLSNRLARRVRQVAAHAQALAGGGPERLPVQADIAEIAALDDSLNQLAAAVAEREARLRALNAELEDQVRERTLHLERSNAELAQTVEALRRTQSELIQSEKLAALGGLVASVAHEMNTPIGNALMACTSLAEQGRHLREASAKGALTRRQFDDGLRAMEEAASLAERSARRAAELVSSFKRVAVDQTSEVYRSFELRELCTEISTLLTPTLRRQGATVVLELPEELELSGYPGPLGQVLTNLIENAALHGLRGGEGRIQLQARAVEPDSVRLEVSDSGQGMSAEVQARIFEPFFTTRRGQGGTGLGLTIVHNLVTGTLKGQLSLRSSPGAGSCFSLLLPRHLPPPTSPQGL